MPSHHPEEHLLLDYAAGSLAEPVGLLIATHLALCPLCRGRVEDYEGIGGALLEDAEPLGLDDDLLARVLERLEAPEAALEVPVPRSPVGLGVPEPLRSYLGGDLETLTWRAWPGMKEHRLLLDHAGTITRLLSIAPEKALPQHSHEGEEYILVLRGGFTDGPDHFLPGDVAMADPSVDHSPLADPGEACLCLAVNTGPLRFTGRYLKILNPLLKT
jgi:putative transcriptional regulator